MVESEEPPLVAAVAAAEGAAGAVGGEVGWRPRLPVMRSLSWIDTDSATRGLEARADTPA